MLTDDLIRSKIDGNTIRPRYITRKRAETYFPLSEDLFRIFRKHAGKTRSELESAVQALEGDRVDFKVIRGLAKLLMDECEFLPRTIMDYTDFRKRIFLAAQKHYPVVSRPDLLHRQTRGQTLSAIAEETGCLPETIDSLLYGDLPENLILHRFQTDLNPETLLKRYNLAQAQGILYHALNMTVRVRSDYRTVIQYIKLCGLMHWITPLDKGGIQLSVDGPASLFHHTQRYGVRMARFLPGLLLAESWEMSAEIQTSHGFKIFKLDSDSGLSSHYRPVSLFDSLIEKRFFEKFARRDRKWIIERETEIFDLGDAVFLPDFTFRHPDGRSAHLEIVGFWTPEYLTKKLDKIKRAGRNDLILAVNSQLNCSRDDFPGEVLFYRTGIKISEVLEALERAGKRPETGA